MSARECARGGPIAALAILFLLLAFPASGGDRAGAHGRPDDPAGKRRLALSIRIAEARDRRAAREYLRSLARQQKGHRPHAPATRRPR